MLKLRNPDPINVIKLVKELEESDDKEFLEKMGPIVEGSANMEVDAADEIYSLLIVQINKQNPDLMTRYLLLKGCDLEGENS